MRVMPLLRVLIKIVPVRVAANVLWIGTWMTSVNAYHRCGNADSTRVKPLRPLAL